MAILSGVVILPGPAYSQNKASEERKAVEERKKQFEQRRATLMADRARIQAERLNVKEARSNAAAAAAAVGREQQGTRKWICNAYGNEHNSPSECSDPGAGGRWITKPGPNLGQAQDRQRELQKRLDDMERALADQQKKYDAAIAQLEADKKELIRDLNKVGLTMRPTLLKGDEASVREYTSEAAEFAWKKPIKTATANLAKDKELVAELANAAKESKYLKEADLKVIAAIESQADRNVGTNEYGYKGLFQMGKKAAEAVGYDYAKLGEPGAWKTDVAAGTKYLEKSAEAISQKGIAVTPLNIYFAHQQGVEGAARILDAVADGSARTKPATRNQISNLPPSYVSSITSAGNSVTLQNYYDYMSGAFKSVADSVGNR
jgi:hypothetical protein